MKVINKHERAIEADLTQVGPLLDSLASRADRLWPKHLWPRLEFDRGLGVGAKGGHGPIRYFVEDYTPGKSIQFRFTGPRGFHGYYGYEVVGDPGQSVVLKNYLKMNTSGPALVTWPLIFRPLHDALIEDSFTVAQSSLGLFPEIKAWSLWVRLLRWVMSGGKARAQVVPAAGQR